MILVKLGGSIITDKTRPLSIRSRILNSITQSLAWFGEPLVLVHGGGSFGHYWSVEYDMHTAPDEYELEGVSEVKTSMTDLNGFVARSMMKNRLYPYCVPPEAFMHGGKLVPAKVKMLDTISKSGMVPVTYGDALWTGKKTYILSGDVIMAKLAQALKPELCVFLLNVDGLYNNMEDMELIPVFDPDSEAAKKIMAEIRAAKKRDPESEDAPDDPGPMDVTGGMLRKVERAIEISNAGIPVLFTNGKYARNMLDVRMGWERHAYGTLFRGRKRA